MAISISSRVRNAMIGLTLGLSLLFTVLIFLLVYVIEDKVFVNQIKVAQLAFENTITKGEPQKIDEWQPANANIQRVDSAINLPSSLSKTMLSRIIEQPGVHEYFDDDHALFIASLSQPTNQVPYYLVYDVKDLLVVRDTKQTLFVLIGGLTLVIALVAVMLARRLSKATLAPVSRLSHALRDNDLDHVVIELANEFSEDEIGVLTHQLAQALERVRESARREYEFNRGVSHELRSPIQIAQSATELLQLYTAEGDEKIAKPVSRLQRSVTEMNEVAEAFLWLASDRRVEPNEMCSVTTLQSTVVATQSSFPNHRIVVSTGSAEEFHYPLPSTVLSVVLRNLIRNAVVHGEPSPINVELYNDRVTVSNSVSTSQQDTKGFGMGLSIVQRICDRFSCELRSESHHGDRYVSSVVFP